MEALSLVEIAEDASGALIQGRPAAMASGVSTDTRSLKEGELYVALKGDRFDGHDFLAQAAQKGAAAVLVSSLPSSSEEISCGIIRVADTLRGLQLLAKNYRDRLGLTVVAVTGSSGKTSTKDFLAAVLAEAYRVNATEGNLNNHIGLPLTMLRADREHTCGVWEMGMNHPGEIEVLAELASPDVAVITNVGVAHIEYMKSRDAIAREKGMLAEAVGPGGSVVLSASDDFSESIRGRTRARVLTAGIESGEVRAENLESDLDGSRFCLCVDGKSVEARIGVTGRHMVQNALLAAGVGVCLGMEAEAISAGLGKARLAAGRLEKKEIGGVIYFDDSYNANPESVAVAINTLAELPCEGRRIAVLGAMAELGEGEKREHRAVGIRLAQKGIDMLVTVGAVASGIGDGALECESGTPEIHRFEDLSEAGVFLRKNTHAGDLVLVKGSRAAGMESVLKEVGVR
ncbi:MAG: UDP-N-acetylmuramoyl-tripeptide--D-alanyl-D-alanine ligase [Verrucomicrobiales bacterium]